MRKAPLFSFFVFMGSFFVAGFISNAEASFETDCLSAGGTYRKPARRQAIPAMCFCGGGFNAFNPAHSQCVNGVITAKVTGPQFVPNVHVQAHRRPPVAPTLPATSPHLSSVGDLLDVNPHLQSQEVERLHGEGRLLIRAMDAKEVIFALAEAQMDVNPGPIPLDVTAAHPYLEPYTSPFDDQRAYKYKSTTLLPPSKTGGGGIRLFNGKPLFLVIDGEMCGQSIAKSNKGTKGGLVAVYRANGFTYATTGRGNKISKSTVPNVSGMQPSETPLESIEVLRQIVRDQSMGSPGVAIPHNEVLLAGIDPRCIKGFGMTKGQENNDLLKDLSGQICRGRKKCFPIFSYDSNKNEMTDITSQIIGDSLAPILMTQSETILDSLGQPLNPPVYNQDGLPFSHLNSATILEKPFPLMSVLLPGGRSGSDRLALTAIPAPMAQKPYAPVMLQVIQKGKVGAERELDAKLLYSLFKALIEQKKLSIPLPSLDKFKTDFTRGHDTVSFGSLVNVFGGIQSEIDKDKFAADTCKQLATNPSAQEEPGFFNPGNPYRSHLSRSQTEVGGVCEMTPTFGGVGPLGIRGLRQNIDALGLGMVAPPIDVYDEKGMQDYFNDLARREGKDLTVKQAGSAFIPVLSDPERNRFFGQMQEKGYPTSPWLKLFPDEIEAQKASVQFDDHFTRFFPMSGGMPNPRDLVISSVVTLTGRGDPRSFEHFDGSFSKLNAIQVSTAGVNLSYPQEPVEINGKKVMMPSDTDEFIRNGSLDVEKYQNYMKMKWISILQTFGRRGVTVPILPGLGLGAFVPSELRPLAAKTSAEALQQALHEVPPFRNVIFSVRANSDEGQEICKQFTKVFHKKPGRLTISGRSMFDIAADVAANPNTGGVPGIVNASDREALLTGNLGQFWFSGHKALEEFFPYTTTSLLSNFNLTRHFPEGYKGFLNKLGVPSDPDQLDEIITEFQTNPNWKILIQRDAKLRALLHKFLSGDATHHIGKMRLSDPEVKLEMLKLSDAVKNGLPYQGMVDHLHYLTDSNSIQHELGLTSLTDAQKAKIRQLDPLARRGFVMYLTYLNSSKTPQDDGKFFSSYVGLIRAHAANPNFNTSQVFIDWLNAAPGTTLVDDVLLPFFHQLTPSTPVQAYHILGSGTHGGAVGHNVTGGGGRFVQLPTAPPPH